MPATLQTGLLSSTEEAAGLRGCGPGTALGMGNEWSLLLSLSGGLHPAA